MKQLALLGLCLLPFCTGCPGDLQDRGLAVAKKKAAIVEHAPPTSHAANPLGVDGDTETTVIRGIPLPSSPAAQSTAAQGPVGQMGEEKAGAVGGAKKTAPVERKIRYTGTIQLICDDFPKAEDGLQAAIKAHKGRIAHSEMSSSPGSPRSGVWRVRVPVPEFEAFRDAVRKLGEVEKNTADSEDLTELYYDLENHIKNKLAEEESLRKLLEKSGNEKIENILAIRRELAEVRDDINRKQGKLNLLANLTDLTTVTVTLRERQKYDPTPPPDIAETPTFGTRIDVTFNASWDRFVAALQFLVIAAIAAVPWLALPAVVAMAIGIVVRQRRRTPPAAAQVAASAPPSTS
jgi:hypothetical protein